MTQDKCYTDGMMRVYRSAASGKNPQGLRDLAPVVSLAYNRMSCRVQDTEFAGQMGFNLSQKVETPRLPSTIPADTTMWVVIGNELYSVQWVDYNATTLYWYMERVRKLEGSA